MKQKIKRTIEVIRSAHLKTLIPKIRSSKFTNKTYSIVVIKGFPGVWHHQDLLDWASQNKLEINIIDFGLQIRGIKFYVKKLETIINKNFNNKKIILLGFSMGGLIAVQYATETNWKNITKIITFATPFNGSVAAKKYKFLPAAVDLDPNSKFLKELYCKIPKGKLICVSAETDELIDNSGSFLPESKHIILKVYNHANAQIVKYIMPILEKEILKYKL